MGLNIFLDNELTNMTCRQEYTKFHILTRGKAGKGHIVAANRANSGSLRKGEEKRND